MAFLLFGVMVIELWKQSEMLYVILTKYIYIESILILALMYIFLSNLSLTSIAPVNQKLCYFSSFW